MKTAIAFLFFALVISTTNSIAQDSPKIDSDWTQILGPRRNAAVKFDGEPGWDDKPNLLWQVDVGEGFAGPVLLGGELVLFHRPGGSSNKFLVVEKFNATNGKSIWKQELTTEFRGAMDGDYGPKATPVIDGEHIYCHGPDGKLACLKFSDGEIVWEVLARKTYKAAAGYFGCGSSPIVIGDKVLLNVGGRREASIVAFNKKTGKEVWKAVSDEASYSSPIAVEFNGKTIAIFLTRTKFIGIDPDDGNVLFSNTFGQKGPKAVASMPIAFGSKIFANAAYGVGAVVVDLKNLKGDGSSVEPDWSSRDAFASHYGTPVFHEGHFYGTTGREDMGNGSFRCIEAETGKVKWDQPSFPVAHTLAFENHMLVLDHKGRLHVIEYSTDAFKRVQETTAFRGQTRPIPAFSDGILFFRSNARSNVGKLIALRVAK